MVFWFSTQLFEQQLKQREDDRQKRISEDLSGDASHSTPGVLDSLKNSVSDFFYQLRNKKSQHERLVSNEEGFSADTSSPYDRVNQPVPQRVFRFDSRLSGIDAEYVDDEDFGEGALGSLTRSSMQSTRSMRSVRSNRSGYETVDQFPAMV